MLGIKKSESLGLRGKKKNIHMFDSKSLFPSLKFAIFQHFIGST